MGNRPALALRQGRHFQGYKAGQVVVCFSIIRAVKELKTVVSRNKSPIPKVMKKQQPPVPPPQKINIFKLIYYIVTRSFLAYFFLLFTAAILFPRAFEPSKSTSTTTASTASYTAPKPESDRVLLGNSGTGYSLWLDKSSGCVYVKDLTEGDLQRLNTDINGFKSAVKQQTGARCVYFE
jgi:hypothetical protein